MRFEFRHVALVLESVARLGARTDDLLKFAGLEPDAATQPAVVGSFERIETLLTEAARRTRVPSFGVALARQVPRGRFGWLEFGMRTSPTLEASLQLLARYSGLINRDAGYVYAAREHDSVLTYETPRLERGLGPQLNEFTLSLVLSKLLEGSGRSWSPTRVWFAHERATSDEVAAQFSCPVVFGEPSSGFSLDRRDALAPLPGHDPALHELMRSRLHELLPVADSTRTTTARVRGEVVARLGSASVAVADIARAIGTSSRTLQRELASEGTTFVDLLEGSRRALAQVLLLRADLTVGEVSALLGYADLRGFDRAFERWTGKSPSAWRAAR